MVWVHGVNNHQHRFFCSISSDLCHFVHVTRGWVLNAYHFTTWYGSGLGSLRGWRLAAWVSMVHMLGVGSTMWKSLQALFTFKRLLAWVQPFVLYQMMFVLESLTALITLVRSLIYSKKKRKKIFSVYSFHFLFLSTSWYSNVQNKVRILHV